MSQTVPATCVLGPGKTGLAIGLRVLNLDGTTYSAFATTDVAETSTLGTYRKASGAVVPDAGGYIVWGVSGTDYAEATVDSTAVNVTLWKGATAPDASTFANAGTYSYSNTVDDGSGNLLDGVFIQLATNSNFANIVATTYTNAIGAFTVRSDTAGTHYLRLQLAGYNFSDQTVTLA